MRRIILLMTVATLVVLSTLFIMSASGAHKPPAAKAQNKPPTKTVVIQNFRFKPANITIKRGAKVRWINKDSTAHTATANNGRSFDSGRLGKGQRYTHTFKSAGKKRYHCEPHPHMRGTVVVKR